MRTTIKSLILLLITTNLLAESSGYFNSYDFFNKAKNGDVKSAIRLCGGSEVYGYRILDQKTYALIREVPTEEIIPICKIASDSGDLDSQRVYANHIKFSKDERLKRKAFELLLKVARSGEALAYIDIGVMYTMSPFTNYKKAEFWYKKATKSEKLKYSIGKSECYLASVYFLNSSAPTYDLKKAQKYIYLGLGHSKSNIDTKFCNQVQKLYEEVKSNNSSTQDNNSKNSNMEKKYYDDENSFEGY